MGSHGFWAFSKQVSDLPGLMQLRIWYVDLGMEVSGLANQSAKVEEIPNPTVEGPRIMIACVAIGIFTGFIFLTVLLLVAGDLTNVISNAAGPLLAIFYNATGNKAGSICLLMYVVHHDCWDTPAYPIIIASRLYAYFSLLLPS